MHKLKSAKLINYKSSRFPGLDWRPLAVNTGGRAGNSSDEAMSGTASIWSEGISGERSRTRTAGGTADDGERGRSQAVGAGTGGVTPGSREGGRSLGFGAGTAGGKSGVLTSVRGQTGVLASVRGLWRGGALSWMIEEGPATGEGSEECGGGGRRLGMMEEKGGVRGRLHGLRRSTDTVYGKPFLNILNTLSPDSNTGKGPL